MKNRSKTFLHVSNIIISLLCVVAILSYFLLPVWSVSLAVRLTPALAENISSEVNGRGEKKQTSRPENGLFRFVALETANTGNEAAGAGEISGNEFIDALFKALGEEGITLSVSGNFDAAELVRSLIDRSAKVLTDEIDSAVDQFVSDTGEIIDEVLNSTVQKVAKEVVRSRVREMISNNTAPDETGAEGAAKVAEDVLADAGIDETALDAIIDRIVSAVMADDATVDSVTAVIMASFDEALGLLADSEKYSEAAGKVTAEDKAEAEKAVRDFLKEYADESGRITLKDSLITMVVNMANDALSGSAPDSSADTPEAEPQALGMAFVPANGGEFAGTAVSGSDKSGASGSTDAAVESLKASLKSLLAEKTDEKVLGTARSVLAAAAIIMLIAILLFAFPVVRSLTKIGAANPGFVLAAPIVAGIVPFLLLYVIPNLASTVFKSWAAVSGSSTPIGMLLGASTLEVTSCTVVGFAVSVIILVYSFFYGHFRRKLARES